MCLPFYTHTHHIGGKQQVTEISEQAQADTKTLLNKRCDTRSTWYGGGKWHRTHEHTNKTRTMMS